MSKWWLVSDEALNIVHAALQAPAGNIEQRRQAQHELTCGTSETDAIPADWQKEAPVKGAQHSGNVGVHPGMDEP